MLHEGPGDSEARVRELDREFNPSTHPPHRPQEELRLLELRELGGHALSGDEIVRQAEIQVRV